MDEILEKKKKQLGIYAKVAAGDSTSLLEYMLDIEEYLDSIKERFDEITKGKLRDVDYERIISESINRIPTPKDGEKPSPKELIDIILPLIPEVKDGNDAVVDYEKIISEVVSQIHIPEDGKDGKDGSPDTSEDIRNKLELLEGDERLSVNAISGLDKFALVSDLKNIRTTVVGGGSANVQVLKNGMPVGSGAALDFRGAGIASVTHDGHTGVITITGGGGGGGIQTITGDDSIDVDATDPENPIISLVNDADAPGNSKYYGTDGSGNKGFFTFPSGGAVAFSDLTGSPNDNAALSSALSAKAPTASPTFTGTVAVPATNFTVGASLPFSDSSGVLTLQNVDAIDSTTESTIEAAIDTLANLTSIQGRTVTLADAGADRLFGWDDSANAYVNLSAADALAALGVTATATELNYVGGVTSAIQTQLNAKAATSHTHTLAAVTDVTATASEVNVLDGITASTTELNYTDGVTSNIQSQLNIKEAKAILSPIPVSITTAAGTAAKVGTTSGGSYTPAVGDILLLDFTNSNTAYNPTLNIDGSGDIAIRVAGQQPTNLAITGTSFIVYYDGTYYEALGSQRVSDYNPVTVNTEASFVVSSTSPVNANTNYFHIANSSSRITYNLAASTVAYAPVAIIGKGSGGFRVAPASGDSVYIDDQVITYPGYIDFPQGGYIKLMSTTQNDVWTVETYIGEAVTDAGYNFSIATLGKGGTGASLSDPGADRIFFWDDSAGATEWLELGTNLSIAGTTLNAAGGGGTIVHTYTSNSSWTKPAGNNFVGALFGVLGAGGGGGGGSKQPTASGASAYGGGWGGGGGGFQERFYPASFLTDSAYSITVGVGGIGGAGATSNSTLGGNGTGGGASYISNSSLLVSAGGGGAGTYGQNFTSVGNFPISGMGGSSGVVVNGNSGVPTTNTAIPWLTNNGAWSPNVSIGGNNSLAFGILGGVDGMGGQPTFNMGLGNESGWGISGGGAGGSPQPFGNNSGGMNNRIWSGARSSQGGGGGGGGGAGDTTSSGRGYGGEGAFGTSGWIRSGGGAGGNDSNVNGGNGTAMGMGGGGGRGGSNGSNAGNGGVGYYGSGGGGGGACANNSSTVAGAGGNGGDGLAYIVEFYGA